MAEQFAAKRGLTVPEILGLATPGQRRKPAAEPVVEPTPAPVLTEEAPRDE